MLMQDWEGRWCFEVLSCCVWLKEEDRGLEHCTMNRGSGLCGNGLG